MLGKSTWSAARVKALVADFAGLDLLVTAGHAALGDARGVGATRPPPRRGRAHAQAADLHPQAFRALTTLAPRLRCSQCGKKADPADLAPIDHGSPLQGLRFGFSSPCFLRTKSTPSRK